MKNILRKKLPGLWILLFLAAPSALFSQTSGTLSFSVTTTSTGGFSPSHYLAIWIENSSTVFIKTKIRYTNPDDLDHMQTWVTKSGENVVDATTGATLNSHGTITFLWNGTNVAGTLVADGSYFVWLEMAWAASLTTGKTVNSFPFTKGAAEFHSTPANTANLSSIAIDWVPATTAVEGVLENKDITVYPNPSSGLVNIDFKDPHDECFVEIMNDDGKVVYNEKLTGVPAGLKTFNLSGNDNGIYFFRLRFSTNEIVFRVILLK
jgi:flagellar hook assembly protein FlgD